MCNVSSCPEGVGERGAPCTPACPVAGCRGVWPEVAARHPAAPGPAAAPRGRGGLRAVRSEQGRPATGGGGPRHGSPARRARRVGAVPAAPAPAEPAARRARVGGQGRGGVGGDNGRKAAAAGLSPDTRLALPTAGARQPRA